MKKVLFGSALMIVGMMFLNYVNALYDSGSIEGVGPVNVVGWIVVGVGLALSVLGVFSKKD